MRNRILGFVVLLTTAPAVAAPLPPKQLVIAPAAAPMPALKYQLLPDAGELTSGNAVQLYYRAMSPEALAFSRNKDISDKLEKWQMAPAKELPRDEMAWLLKYAPVRDCDAGARRQSCDWELTQRIRVDGPMALMGDIQSMRSLNRLVVLRGRYQAISGDYAGAVRSYQTSLGMARHVGEAPNVISQLIGVACARQALDGVEELIQQPNSPNLYWALTGLPRPFFDLKLGLQGEKLMVLSIAPDVKEGDPMPMTPREIARLRERLDNYLPLFEGDSLKEISDGKEFAVVVEKLLPDARKALIAAGYKEKDVDALPPLQAVVLDALTEHRRLLDEMTKLSFLPYAEARPRLRELEKQLKAPKRPMLALVGQMLSGLSKVSQSVARTDRQIAMLRCIEAVRLYAAAHDGKLPAKLADISEVPVPLDPMTGKDFDYKVQGDKVTLFAPAPTGEEPTPSNVMTYELTLKK